MQEWPEAETRATKLVDESRLPLRADDRRGLITAIAIALWEAHELGRTSAA